MASISEQLADLRCDLTKNESHISELEEVQKASSGLLEWQFLAGGNQYASLANLLLSCHAVFEELKSTMNETVILDGKSSDFLRIIKSESAGRERFKYTKYLIIAERHNIILKDIFPNLRVQVIIEAMDEYLPLELPCRIRIRKTVGIAMLFELLQIPLFWPKKEPNNFWCSIAHEIDAITIRGAVWVSGSGFTLQKSVQHSTDHIPNVNTTFTLAHKRPSPELRGTLLNLLWLVLHVDSQRPMPTPRIPQTHYKIPYLEFRGATGVPIAGLIVEALELSPIYNICPDVTINLTREYGPNDGRKVTSKQLEEHMSKAAQIYTRVWSKMLKHAHPDFLDPDRAFYSVDCNDDDAPGMMYGELSAVDLSGERLELMISFEDEEDVVTVTTYRIFKPSLTS
ncbi:hypothetical protein QFC21_006066 [Naganishia friedmannii]|uniref:Uncharacterized protein n=1 Tax=Naganishia friedmannii TaxID=89922 RepID=A0ACC2V4D4_9TREE|nr:hypothetical protein QFC21_006066 [Naganishia friedmannii]